MVVYTPNRLYLCEMVRAELMSFLAPNGHLNETQETEGSVEVVKTRNREYLLLLILTAHHLKLRITVLLFLYTEIS